MDVGREAKNLVGRTFLTHVGGSNSSRRLSSGKLSTGLGVVESKYLNMPTESQSVDRSTLVVDMSGSRCRLALRGCW